MSHTALDPILCICVFELHHSHQVQRWMISMLMNLFLADNHCGFPFSHKPISLHGQDNNFRFPIRIQVEKISQTEINKSLLFIFKSRTGM